MTLFLLDPAFWAGVLVSVFAYAVGAAVHIYIDQRMGARLVTRYFETTRSQIVEPAMADLKASLLSEFRAAMPEPVKVPSVDEISAKVGERLEMKLYSAAGAEARTTQTELSKKILAVSTGNPLLDGAIAMADPTGEQRRKWAARLAKQIYRGQGTPEPEAPVVEGETADGWR